VTTRRPGVATPWRPAMACPCKQLPPSREPRRSKNGSRMSANQTRAFRYLHPRVDRFSRPRTPRYPVSVRAGSYCAAPVVGAYPKVNPIKLENGRRAWAGTDTSGHTPGAPQRRIDDIRLSTGIYRQTRLTASIASCQSETVDAGFNRLTMFPRCAHCSGRFHGTASVAEQRGSSLGASCTTGRARAPPRLLWPFCCSGPLLLWPFSVRLRLAATGRCCGGAASSPETRRAR
jgi:hypothetical protein